MPRPSGIVLVAGGTGGHVMPAWALAEKLAEQPRQEPCILVTDPRGQAFLPAQKPGLLEQTVLPPLSPWKGVFHALFWFRGFWHQFRACWHLLGQKNPRVVAGFGGYPSLAMGLAAWIRGVPLLVHEQNAVMGRTNRLLSPGAHSIWLTFPDTARQTCPRKAIVTGNPVRKAVRLLARTPSCPPAQDKPFALLVLGGSQGAAFFARILPDAVDRLPHALKSRMHIIQQCRPEQVEALQAVWASMKIPVEVSAFFPDVATCMHRAHALVSRAGASTLSEWMAFGKPALFVPWSGATNQHQKANAFQASTLDPSGRTRMVDESTLNALFLTRWLTEVMTQPSASAPDSRWMPPEKTLDMMAEKIFF